ncbi:nuclear transport factor NTF-2 [Penicillium herquei]|nr:nuclear transport factor NTF-2 [Penicillium herquei]
MTNPYHALGDTLRKLNTDNLVFIKRDLSMFTFETVSIMGAQAIVKNLTKLLTKEILQELPFQKVKHQVKTLDAQPSHGNSIVILVTGALLADEEQRPMNYTQYFELMPENGSYWVQNDISRLTMP